MSVSDVFTRLDMFQEPRAGLSVLHSCGGQIMFVVQMHQNWFVLSPANDLSGCFQFLAVMKMLLWASVYDLSVDIHSLLGVHLGMRSLVNHVRNCQTMNFLWSPETGTSLPLEPLR